MATTRLQLNSTWKKAVAVVVCLFVLAFGWMSIRWHLANAVGYKLNPRQPESRLVLDWLIEQAPADPQIRTSAGRILEKTFDIADAQRAIAEYERAVALSPYDHRTWLDLARARSANGDTEIAQAAYEKALKLAPNYSTVNWAFGNFLLRTGDTARGTEMIAKAANADPVMASASVSTLFTIFDGDAARVAAALGNGAAVTAAMALGFASLGSYREAVAAWLRLDETARMTTYARDGAKLIERLVADHQYRFATAVAASQTTEGSQPPQVETLTNGDLESTVKLRDAGHFEWKLANGSEPQIGLGESQKHTGRFSLWLTFNSFETAGFREISQTVAVLPGVTYKFDLHYRSDVKTDSRMKWEIVDPQTLAILAATPPLEPTAEWTNVTFNFKAPAAIDGVKIRFNRDGCIGPTCRTTGRIMFDDIAIRRID